MLVPAGSLDGWLRVVVAVGAPLAVLAAIAYAETQNIWSRRALSSVALIAAAAAIAGVFVLVYSIG